MNLANCLQCVNRRVQGRISLAYLRPKCTCDLHQWSFHRTINLGGMKFACGDNLRPSDNVSMPSTRYESISLPLDHQYGNWSPLSRLWGLFEVNRPWFDMNAFATHLYRRNLRLRDRESSFIRLISRCLETFWIFVYLALLKLKPKMIPLAVKQGNIAMTIRISAKKTQVDFPMLTAKNSRTRRQYMQVLSITHPRREQVSQYLRRRQRPQGQFQKL